MSNEMVKVENNQLVLAEDVIMNMRKLKELTAQLKLTEDRIKEATLNAMEQNGIKSYENDYFKITYKGSYEKSSVDTQALKEQGLYESFVKKTIVKPSVVVSYK